MASHAIITAKRSALTTQAAREHAISRRIEHVAVQLEEARAQVQRAQIAVHAAEAGLLARRLECEAAVIHLADLADLLETLQEQSRQYWRRGVVLSPYPSPCNGEGR